MKVVIGADHRGFLYKEYLKQLPAIDGISIEWIDVGAYDDARSDYPVFARSVCQTMERESIAHGILLCGSGVGMAVAANRFKHIYAALVWNAEIARLSVEDDNANVLVIPSCFVKQEDLIVIISAWLHARFRGGRYQHRIDMIDAVPGAL